VSLKTLIAGMSQDTSGNPSALVPAGGLTGEVLKKSSGTDYATVWGAEAPAIGNVTGLGTAVAAALAVAIGSAGAPVVNGGALGTPSSGSGANLTALNASNVSSGDLAVARIATALTTPGPIGGTTRSTSAFTTLAANGAVTFTAGTASSSTTTGTLVITGGLGVSGAIYAATVGSDAAEIVNSIAAFRLKNTGKLCWSQETYAQGTLDLGMSRSSAGVAEITNGTTGTYRDLLLRSITLSGAFIATPQALSGAGAVNLTTASTAFTSTGAAQALTLANGTAGQIKTICHVVDGGSGVLTPTTASGYTTITFTNVGDSVTLQYHTTAGWCVIGISAATLA